MTTSGGLAVRCPCGLEVVGADEQHLVDAVNAHLAERHPDRPRTYDVDDVLALAYRRPRPDAGPHRR